MSSSKKFEPVEESSDSNEEELDDGEEDEDSQDTGSDLDDNNLPVLRQIVSKGKISVDDASGQSEEAERKAIQEELSALSFEELQKLKEKLGSKKFNQTLRGKAETRGEPEKKEQNFKRANKNRPREMSSKCRKLESKVAIQVPKVFKNDPRFDSLCGEFHEKVGTG